MSLKSLKHYRIGDIITTCKPLAYVVVDQMKTRLCDYCLQKKRPLMSCDDCHQMFYCNQICQQNDWSAHRLECHILANSPHLKSSAKLMIRLWLLSENNPSFAFQVHSLPNGQYLCLNDMKVNGYIDEDINALMDQMTDNSIPDLEDLSCLDHISTKDMAVLQFKALIETFNECQIDADLVKLWKLFLRVWSNVLKMDVLDVDSGDSAYGLFVEISSLSHSCEPNACYVSYGTRLQVRAIKPIKPNEEITISYIDIANSKAVRQQLLKSYFIVCNCLKCQSSSESVIKYDVFDQLSEELNSMIKGINKHNIEDLLSTADQLVPFYESIYEDCYPELSIFLMKYLKVMLMNAIDTKAVVNRKFLDFVVHNVSTTHGVDHRLYKKLTIVRDITLKDLATDADQVIKCLKAKPMPRLVNYSLRALLCLVIYIIFYTNFGDFFRKVFE